MKYLNHFIPLGLLAVMALLSTSVYSQDSYGSQCLRGRQVSIFKSKYAIEFIAPINWQGEKYIARNKGFSYLFYPFDDSLSRKTSITIKVYPDLPVHVDKDSLILCNYAERMNELKMSEIKENLHRSIPASKRMVIKHPSGNIVKSATFIYFDDYLVEYCFTPEDLKSYERYSVAYEVLVSSIRFSEL